MSTPQNVVSWFEIPVADFARAKTFYEIVLDTHIELTEIGKDMGCFAHFVDTEGNRVGTYSLK